MTVEILTKELRSLYDSALYGRLLAEVQSNLKLDISDSIPEIIYTYDIRDIQAANISTSEILHTIETDFERIKNFVVAKMRALKGEVEEQEYSPDEPPDKDDKPGASIKLPYYRNFLIIYFIEYLILRDRPESLVNYLKAIRIPNAAKYGKQLKEIYKNSGRS